ncbi:hypothetical protein ISN44_As10g023510 [Arabidopsis suecica]|uniref:Uncharacterized protein n=1 Tax=Arabidopsis suecica TaxID=45249 RepID=A0A8T1XP38_ARASU|nr:hypothetical protein ISN44_As13g003810 [Arabidopsis suecica]KAG7565705.1 hypothetical protein ISN44_As10g023510 [Arabidopsis suecica]
MDADDDFYSGTENYSDYADSDEYDADADYEFVEDAADDSDDLIFRRRQSVAASTPTPAFYRPRSSSVSRCSSMSPSFAASSCSSKCPFNKVEPLLFELIFVDVRKKPQLVFIKLDV